jgi:hypothetical protein
MKVVMTLLARNEVDIVDAQLAFHLNAGVDFVIATDNGSTDGTTEIFESYERDGCLKLFRQPSDEVRQREWVVAMARLAATDYGADWVINSDADEFWWPRSAPLKEILAAVPPHYGVVQALWRHFPPPAHGGDFFAERMTVRLSPKAPLLKGTQFRTYAKAIHRADPDVRVGTGNHTASLRGLPPLRGWYPVELLHFPVRSLEQCERKYVSAWKKWTNNPVRHPHDYITLAYEAWREGRLAELYATMAVDEKLLARGLEDGTLVEDVRLRDALRRLRREAPESSRRAFLLPRELERPLELPRADIVDEMRYALESTTLIDADLARLQRRLDRIEGQLAAMQAKPWRRVAARARRLLAHP